MVGWREHDAGKSSCTMADLVKRVVPEEAKEFELGRWAVLTPQKREMLYLSVYRSNPMTAGPSFYVVSWSANANFRKLFAMTQVSHQEMAAHHELSPIRLQYTLSSQLKVDKFAFHDLDSKGLDEYLRLKPTSFARADGPFFGISLDKEHKPGIVCFASYYKMPYAVSAIWAASNAEIGQELTQNDIRVCVKEATSQFPEWNPEMYTTVSRALRLSTPIP
jgi:hypothetical protein